MKREWGWGGVGTALEDSVSCLLIPLVGRRAQLLQGPGLIPSNGGNPLEPALGEMAAPCGLVGRDSGAVLQPGSGSAGAPGASWGLADLGSYLSSIPSCCLALWEPLHLSEPHL